MTGSGIPMGHLATSARHWARHLRTPDLRPLPGTQWEDAGTRGGDCGPRPGRTLAPQPGPLQALCADGKAAERSGTGEETGRCGGWSETENVSTSGRNLSLSVAVWLCV